MEKNLYTAVISDNLKALTRLQGDDLNILQQLTPTRNTALHVAAYHGHLQSVRMLLSLLNQDIEAGNQDGHRFLTARNEEGNTALHEAAIGGHYGVVEALLEYHTNLVDIINHNGETALFKATEEGQNKIVKKLLPLTSSPYHRRTSDGQTLLQCAIYNTHKGVLKTLIAVNPELLQQVDNLGRTPLHNVACLSGISHIAKTLLEKDSSLCYKVDNNHQSALHIAVKEGNLDLVNEILNYAKDCIEIVDNEGRTALHLAVENAVEIFDRISRSIKTLVLLVTSRRLINKPDKLGRTALDIAIHNMGNDERLFYGIKRLLETNGARKTAKTMEETKECSLTSPKSSWKFNLVSVNAVLIAAVAFDTPFNLLDKAHSQKYRVFFPIRVMSDALAFCSSITSAVLLIYALYGKQEDPLLLKTSLTGLWIALISLLLTFGAGTFIMVEPHNKLVAVTVLVMVTIVPICIRIMIFRSKKYIFREDEHHLWTLLIVGSIQMTLLFTLRNTVGISLGEGMGMVLGLMIVWIGISIGPKKFFRPKRDISRDNGYYIWFLLIGSMVDASFILVLLAAEFGW
ncbi:hypothetical protein SUGI_1106010 [Cryptomeria japonica]|uniref:ankyrin repeat-containing protein ITN1 n=1 Tax=Cryptomeria japonica TaxID=3369 RepID=UPI002414ACBE|nr:ankyrin repeat-containing protein ITN1 [Cryptomeria japonica]GLJ52027.1 hypothetical protein SUGI_1106010 [Cryptomeria japonica]